MQFRQRQRFKIRYSIQVLLITRFLAGLYEGLTRCEDRIFESWLGISHLFSATLTEPGSDRRCVVCPKNIIHPHKGRFSSMS